MNTLRAPMMCVIAAVMLLIILTACGANGEQGQTNVMMSPYAFGPATITVKQGSEVTLKLFNTEVTQHGDPHSWTLMEAGYKVEAPFSDEDRQHVLVEKKVFPDESETLTFVAPSEPGEYQVVCTTFLQLEGGMRGKLVVTP